MVEQVSLFKPGCITPQMASEICSHDGEWSKGTIPEVRMISPGGTATPSVGSTLAVPDVVLEHYDFLLRKFG